MLRNLCKKDTTVAEDTGHITSYELSGISSDAALKMKEREQTDSIRMWHDPLPEEEASFVRWYEEGLKADLDSVNPIPSEESKADTDSVNPTPSTTHALTMLSSDENPYRFIADSRGTTSMAGSRFVGGSRLRPII